MHDCTLVITKGLGNSRFVIDGKIEGKPESVYLNKQKAKKTKSIRWSLWGFVCLSFILLLILIYQFTLINTLNSKIEDMASEVQVAKKLIAENEAYKTANDTLQKKIIRIKMDNDILAENSTDLSGIFFEVQIGNFYDFNLDAYLSELGALRQEKVGNNTKLILGRFRSFRKAMLFENDIKKMGFTNAFLIGRIDGKIVDYQDALAAYQLIQGN